MLHSQDIGTVLLVLFSCWSYGIVTAFTCGPNMMCYCTNIPNNGFKMDCESRSNLTLASICSTISNGRQKIDMLKAGRNNFGNLSAADFKGCEHLNELDLHYNQITEIEKHAFINFTCNFTILDISRNLFPVYSNKWDTSFLPACLKTLKLHGSKTIKNAKSCPRLDHLHTLSNLTLDGLPGMVYKYPRVTHLIVSGLNVERHCELATVENFTFAEMTSLQILNISGCGITRITAGAFKHLHNLRVLDLSYNRQLGIKSLENVTYGLQFTEIRHLNISYLYNSWGIGIKLRISDLCYLWNTSVKDLDISGNRIEIIETNALILSPPYLEIVKMAENKFTFGPYLLQLGCLKNLTTAFSQHQNYVPNLIKYVFENTSVDDEKYQSACPYNNQTFLKELARSAYSCHYIDPDDYSQIRFDVTLPLNLENVHVYDCNMIYNLNDNFVFSPEKSYNILYLDASGNVFEYITGEFMFPNLQTLNLCRCYITWIGPSSLMFGNLTILRLAQNYIGDQLANETVSNIFSMLKSLKFLDLSSNGITTLFASTFDSLINLEKLDLRHNTIYSFDISLKTLSNMFYLNIAFNTIPSIDRPIQIQLETKENFSLNLGNNELKYGCKHQEFIQWLIRYREHMEGFQDYHFFDDEKDRHMSTRDVLNDIDHLKYRCYSYTSIIIICVIVLTLFLSIVIGGFVYKNRWKLRYFMYRTRKTVFGYRNRAEYTVIQNYQFDAFISYADDNSRFILDDVIPRLETENVSLCLHQRDFLPGNAISDNIIHAIQRSRRTVVMLSNAFLQSKWCMYEFNMARMESIYSRGEDISLVIVMLEHVPNNSMPLEMLRWIQANNYIEYTTDQEGNVLFWDKLKSVITP